MAFTITQRSSGGNGETSGGSFTTASFTPTANSRLFVFAIAERASTTATRSWSISDTGGHSWVKLDESALYDWSGDANYAANVVCYYTDIGASPSAITVTIDADDSNCYYSVISFDVTGYDAGTPFQQASVDNGASTSGDNVSGTLTLGSNPISGNLVIAMFGASADGGGGFAVPSGYSTLTNQNSSFTQCSVFYHISTTVAAITSSDLGNSVGNWGGIAFEMKLSGGVTGNPYYAYAQQ